MHHNTFFICLFIDLLSGSKNILLINIEDLITDFFDAIDNF